MRKMILIRVYTDMGTFGKLYDNEHNFLCHTVERNWANNELFKSCIPEGEYELVEYHSPRYGKSLALNNPNLNVYVQSQGHGRYACIFHAANYADHLQGCIAPGHELGVVNQKWAVLSSAATLAKLKGRVFKTEKKLIVSS